MESKKDIPGKELFFLWRPEMAGLDPIPFNSPRKEPGEEKRSCKIFMDECWSDTKTGGKKGLSQGPINDSKPWVE